MRLNFIKKMRTSSRVKSRLKICRLCCLRPSAKKSKLRKRAHTIISAAAIVRPNLPIITIRRKRRRRRKPMRATPCRRSPLRPRLYQARRQQSRRRRHSRRMQWKMARKKRRRRYILRNPAMRRMIPWLLRCWLSPRHSSSER